jgi:hypothetical protein
MLCKPMLWAESGVNQEEQPFVLVRHGENLIGQFTPAEARQYAQQLSEAAEAAETDSFLMKFLREKVGAEELETRVQVLQEFRRYREAHGGAPASVLKS